MGEGTEMRRAYDGPDLEHDALISQLEARIREEVARSSDASESAAKVKEFIEATGVNSQALSWAKTILKKLPKKDGELKAMDIIRSLEAMLPMLKDHVGGQQSEMDLSGDTAPEAPVEEPEREVSEEEAAFNDEVDNTVTPINFAGAAE